MTRNISHNSHLHKYFLTKQMTEGFFYFSYGDEIYSYILSFENLHVLTRNNYVCKAKLLGFRHTLFNTAYGTYLSAKSHFARHAPSLLDWGVYIA